MLPDGMTVRVDKKTAYEPDALVYGGQKLARSAAVEVTNPVIVVEVLSPSTARTDMSAKLVGYLIIEPGGPQMIHHARQSNDTILTRIVTGGTIELTPPGLSLCVDDIYREA
jgi:Uma2 family endonuclease